MRIRYSAIKFLSFLIYFFLLLNYSYSQSNEDCFDCHNDEEITFKRSNKEISLYVNAEHFMNSVHGEMDCIDCHLDFDPEEEPHKPGNNIHKVDCSECHDTEEFITSAHGLQNVECFECHTKHQILEASSLTVTNNNLCISCHKHKGLKNYAQSIHGKLNENGEKAAKCIDCHGESTHSISSGPITKTSSIIMCSKCHEEAGKNFNQSLHGKAVLNKKYLAPDCTKCHGSHSIYSSDDERSKTYVMNIPSLCGDCHKDGTQVAQLRSIDQAHILENYSESIHGEGLLKRGLIVTAVCTSCHFSHNILPHENVKSSINRNNIASTCMQCHRNIESVHLKVINGELWEKEPHKIPACIDCHQPHEIRRVLYQQDYTDKLCINCHNNKNLTKTENGKNISLYVDINEHKNSAHKENSCIKCHTNVSAQNNPICLNSGKVDCSICHAEAMDDYNVSEHGKLNNSGNKAAPTCITCHGKHDVTLKTNFDSPTFVKNIPKLCGECHREGGAAAQSDSKAKQHEIVNNYSMSIHGRGLLKSGLIVSATCTDCHTNHRELPADDPFSTINSENIAKTCSKCHLGVYEQFQKSIHSPLVSQSEKQLPRCNDCHKSHEISRVENQGFRSEIMEQCGKCHEEVTETYFDTFHGKVSKLGSIKTAKCSDCHGAHNILPPSNPESTLSRKNVVETCKTCHPGSNRKFVGYLTHATHHDKEKYPVLYYTFVIMSTLLVSTFLFFGMHTLLWLPRGLAERKKKKKAHLNEKSPEKEE